MQNTGSDITQEMFAAASQPSSSQSQDAHVLGPDLVSTPSSLNTVLPGADRISGNKRKQEEDDEDDPSNNEDESRDRKKLKHEAEGLDDGTSSFAMQGVADAASLVTEPQPRLPSLEAQSTLSRLHAAASPPPPLDAPSSHLTGTTDLSPPLTPPPRSHSAPPPSPIIVNDTPKVHQLPLTSSLPPEPEPLHTYSCPICFSAPTNATLTPCGHIMCGECLFTAVGSATARIGISSLAARCPVCRAPIPRWDGRGGGVIGLQPRVIFTI